MDPKHFESSYPPDSRFVEVEKILSYIKSGNSCQVISLPGVGRSNILRLIAYSSACRKLHLKNEANLFHFVMMNFSEMKKKPLGEVTKYMFLEVLESLEQRKLAKEHEAIKEIFDKSLKSGDELVIFQGLKKTIDYLCIEKDMKIVFLFDRFEDYVPMLDAAFFDNLRVLRDRAKYKFSAVFPLNRPLEENLGPEILSSFYEFLVGNIVYLSLGDEKIMRFRDEYLKKTTGKKLDKKNAEVVFKLTGGLGKLWLVCTEALINQEKIDASIKEDLFSNSKVLAVLSEIWKSFSPYEQSLIQTKKTQESSHLVAVGLVKSNLFAVPLLEEFAGKQEKPTSMIHIEEISDQLTNSEFKLLQFMSRNPDKILERDEVINAVWGELSSTLGVSEQALDQLIFRLRKKIEENPNSPTHIQTIKGRGFKYSS